MRNIFKVDRHTLSKMLFFIYFIFLIYLVIFKLNLSIENIARVRLVNLKPFYYGQVVEGDMPLFEAFFNLLVFIPYGFLLKKAFNQSFALNLLLVFGLSFTFELCQYIFVVGVTDITDLITNSAGGIVGLCVANQMKKIKC